jgi:hypothetical protein
MTLRDTQQPPDESPNAIARPLVSDDEAGERADYDPLLTAMEDQQRVSRFDAELAASVDSTPWSLTTEQTVADTLAEGTIPGTSLVDIQCGGDLCRVLLAHDSADTQLEAAQMIPFISPFDTDGFIQFADDESAPQTLLYIAREGTRLPDIGL